MKTIQMTIDEPLLDRVDRVIQELNVSRSQFVRDALLLALQQVQVRKLEAQHEQGYILHPVTPGEFDGWEDEQVWGDE